MEREILNNTPTPIRHVQESESCHTPCVCSRDMDATQAIQAAQTHRLTNTERTLGNHAAETPHTHTGSQLQFVILHCTEF